MLLLLLLLLLLPWAAGPSVIHFLWGEIGDLIGPFYPWISY